MVGHDHHTTTTTTLSPKFLGLAMDLNKLIRVNTTVKKIEKKICDVAQSDLNAQLISTFLEFVRQNSNRGFVLGSPVLVSTRHSSSILFHHQYLEVKRVGFFFGFNYAFYSVLHSDLALFLPLSHTFFFEQCTKTIQFKMFNFVSLII